MPDTPVKVSDDNLCILKHYKSESDYPTYLHIDVPYGTRNYTSDKSKATIVTIDEANEIINKIYQRLRDKFIIEPIESVVQYNIRCVAYSDSDTIGYYRMNPRTTEESVHLVTTDIREATCLDKDIAVKLVDTLNAGGGLQGYKYTLIETKITTIPFN